MSNNDSAIIQDKLMYGIWLKGKGWLRGNNGNVFADYSLEKTAELRNRIGNNAIVYFVDDSLVDLELFLLQIEKENSLYTWWQRLVKRTGKNGISSATS